MAQQAEQGVPRQFRVGVQQLDGLLWLPKTPIGLIIFVHGSGSSRLSPRNAFVAGEIHQAGLATLLFDLLTPAESKIRSNVFDIPLLAERVGEAIAMVRVDPAIQDLPVGLFGSSTGAAAALVAAARWPDKVAAVVSRGGRPDLAAAHLKKVRSPTMLIVGGADTEVVALNRAAFEQLSCTKGLKIIPGATHLFEEAGALEEVVEQALIWFRTHMGASIIERF